MLRTLVDAPQETLLHASKYRKRIQEEKARYFTNPGLELPSLEAHSLQRLEAGQHVSLRKDVVKIGEFGLACVFKG